MSVAVLEKHVTQDAAEMASAPGRPQVTVLDSSAVERICARNHFTPSVDLAPYIAVAWTMLWNLPDDQSFTLQVLPNPCVQIAIRERQAAVFGIVTGAFSATFTGRTFVFGLRFKPCGFYPFAGCPASTFTNRRIALTEVLPRVQEDLLWQLADDMSGQELLNVIEGELRKVLPKSEDQTRREVESLVEELEQNSDILTVHDAAKLSGVSVRVLQRLFREYVGVTPKWLIRRYRLKEAAARIEAGEHENWADFAQKLGYYDQSHLINDFRRMMGQTPALYSQLRK